MLFLCGCRCYHCHPAVLLLRYQVVATSLQVDRDELEEADWFSREDVVAMATRTHPQGLYIPGRQAIANHLITNWLLRTAF